MIIQLIIQTTDSKQIATKQDTFDIYFDKISYYE